MNSKIIYDNFPDVKTINGNQCYDIDGNLIEINWDLYESKLAIWHSTQPLRLLRIKRNQLLQQTDWRATVDYPNSDKQAWLDYRQALRDLPETADPQLDENGQLTNIVWPEEPQ